MALPFGIFGIFLFLIKMLKQACLLQAGSALPEVKTNLPVALITARVALPLFCTNG